jgi:hypothetical protein
VNYQFCQIKTINLLTWGKSDFIRCYFAMTATLIAKSQDIEVAPVRINFNIARGKLNQEQ